MIAKVEGREAIYGGGQPTWVALIIRRISRNVNLVFEDRADIPRRRREQSAQCGK
jgi:hypothetical protein